MKGLIFLIFQYLIPINNLLTVSICVCVSCPLSAYKQSANGGKGSKKGGTMEESLAKEERDLRREF